MRGNMCLTDTFLSKSILPCFFAFFPIIQTEDRPPRHRECNQNTVHYGNQTVPMTLDIFPTTVNFSFIRTHTRGEKRDPKIGVYYAIGSVRRNANTVAQRRRSSIHRRQKNATDRQAKGTPASDAMMILLFPVLSKSKQNKVVIFQDDSLLHSILYL